MCFMEKACTIVCIVLGTVFLVAALLGTWYYLITTGVCYATAILTTEDREH